MHYANGREAKVGDLVVGTAYNTPAFSVPYGSTERPPPKKLVGTLVKATPGSDRCNAEIEWVEIMPAADVLDYKRPRPSMAQGDPRLVVTSGEVMAHFVCRDYTHCGALLHVEDVIAVVSNPADNSHVPEVKR